MILKARLIWVSVHFPNNDREVDSFPNPIQFSGLPITTAASSGLQTILIDARKLVLA